MEEEEEENDTATQRVSAHPTYVARRRDPELRSGKNNKSHAITGDFNIASSTASGVLTGKYGTGSSSGLVNLIKDGGHHDTSLLEEEDTDDPIHLHGKDIPRSVRCVPLN